MPLDMSTTEVRLERRAARKRVLTDPAGLGLSSRQADTVLDAQDAAQEQRKVAAHRGKRSPMSPDAIRRSAPQHKYRTNGVSTYASVHPRPRV